jgi:hypothetical protein
MRFWLSELGENDLAGLFAEAAEICRRNGITTGGKIFLLLSEW